MTVHVGPGVFIPRPETEVAAGMGCRATVSQQPVIVDLCTGSGALALALAKNWPGARVIAVDDSADALAYARRNLAGTAVELIRADVTEPGLLPELDGRVDLLVANPPYIPDGADLEPEVAEHDPAHALFGGPDGMTVIDAIVDLAARWLRARRALRRRARRHHIGADRRSVHPGRAIRRRHRTTRPGRATPVRHRDPEQGERLTS